MSIRLHLDLETFSEADLKAEGLYRYAEHESTDIVVAGYAIDNGTVGVWLPWSDVPDAVKKTLAERAPPGTRFVYGKKPPNDLVDAFKNPAVKICAHNAAFERIVLRGPAGKRYGLPEIPIERVVCTMAKVAVHGLPHALANAAEALGTFPKREVGVSDMRYMSKPRKNGTRPTAQEEPERIVQTTLYNIDDVLSERDLDNNVPNLTPALEQVYVLDQKINDRGVRIDQPAINDIVYLVDQYKEKLAAWCKATTGLNPTQSGKLAEWIRDPAKGNYAKLPDLQAPTVVECLADPTCPPLTRKVLRCYSIVGGKAASKFDAMLRSVAADGRVHGMFQFYGAAPGRWSSRIINLQNMLRSLLKWEDVDTAIAACKTRNLDYIRALFDELDPMKVFGTCTRGMLIPEENRDFIAFDFSQIESAIQAWLAGTEWKLDIIRTGKTKVYNATGAVMFGVKPEEVVDKGELQMYTAAKIGELACGYQGWEKAVTKMARQRGIKLTMDAAEIAGKWREANPRQVQLWYDLNEAAIAAVNDPGKAYAIPNRKIMFKVEGRWLYMRLPSGRRIAYYKPRIVDDSVAYEGVDTDTRRWMTVHTYGGKLLQNACEGIGWDLLVNGLQQMEKAGYETVMHAHDEGTFEVDSDFGDMGEAQALMTTYLIWSEGLPVKANGWRGKRYRK